MGAQDHFVQPRSPDERAAAIAATQFGLLSRAQATNCGFTSSMIRNRLAIGRWHHEQRGVYAIAGVRPTWRRSALGAHLSLGAEAIISHRAAAALLRLPPFRPAGIELIVPRSVTRAPPGAITHRIGPLEACDRTVVQAIPVTSVARTLFDLASVAAPAEVAEAMDDALRRRSVSLARLTWDVGRHTRHGRPGMTLFRELVMQRVPATPEQHSVLETQMLRLLTSAGHTGFVQQYRLRIDGRLMVVDFAFPAERVAIELDGYRWHSGVERFRSDLDRRTRIGSLRWIVLHFTAKDFMDRPDWILGTVSRSLRIPSYEA